MRKLILSLAAVATLASCSNENKEHSKLELNLTKGETYPQNMTVNSTIDQEMMGQKMQIVMDMTANIDYKVEDIQNDVYVLNTTYKGLNIDINAGGQQMHFAAGDTTSEGKFMNNLVGKSFTIHMKKDGTVEKIEGLDNVIDGMMDANDTSMSPQEQQQLMMQIKQSWGAEALTNNLKMATGSYPTDGSTEVGNTWSQTLSLPAAFNLNANIDYTLADASADVYTINGKGTFDMNKDTTLRGAEANINLKGDMTFVYKVDTKTGWITSGTGNQNIGGEIKINAGGQEMVMPMNVKSDIKLDGTTKN